MDSINSWHTSPESGSNPGIDRPNARYNSALWLRAASPEKKRNASLMARAGLETRKGERREGRGRKERDVYSKIFRPSIPPLLCAIERRSLAYKEKGNCGEHSFEVAFYDIAPLSGLRFRMLFAGSGLALPKERNPPLLRQIGQFEP